MTSPAPAPPVAGGRPPLPAGVSYLPMNDVDRAGAPALGDDVRADHPDGAVHIVADPGGLVVHYDFRPVDENGTPYWVCDSVRSDDLLCPADLGALYATHGTGLFAMLDALPDIHECRRQGVTVRAAIRALTAALTD